MRPSYWASLTSQCPRGAPTQPEAHPSQLGSLIELETARIGRLTDTYNMNMPKAERQTHVEAIVRRKQ